MTGKLLDKFRHYTIRYGAAFIGIAVALLWRLAVVDYFKAELPTYITFYPVVMTVALLGGVGPGLLSTVLTVVAVAYWVLPPHGFEVATPIDRFGLALFLCMGTFMSVVAEGYRRSRKKAAAYDVEMALRDSREAMERLSEQRLLALESAALGTWDYHFDSGEVSWDARCRDMFGVPEGTEISYDNAIERIYPSDRGEVSAAVERALAGDDGGAYRREFRVLWPDGSVHWIASHGRVYFGPDGCKAQRFVGVNLDITERKRTEEALHSSEARWGTTLQSIGDAVISTDAAGRVVFMNPVAEELTGWRLAEASGCDLEVIFNIVHEVTRVKAENPVAKVIRLGKIVGLANHTVLISRQGIQIPIDDSAAPIRRRNGEIEGVVLVFHDVSEQRKADAALRTSDRLATTGRLAASLAHEIHNPLDSVGSLLYLIDHLTKDEGIKQYTALASKELARVTQMTRQMLAFQREANKPVAVQIRSVLDSIWALYERKVSAAGIKLERRVEVDGEILALPGELRQVFANLVGNAIEAVKPRHGVVKVHAYNSRDWSDHRKGLRVVIADNGPGIPLDLRNKIFEPFFTTKGEAGTGLGLWITSDIVKKYDGKIQLRSCSNESCSGTCFSVFLPLEIRAESPVRQ